MGEEVPKTVCPTCVADLPNTLNGSIEVPIHGLYEGILTQSEEDPASFAGILTGPSGGTTPMYVSFCNEEDAIIMTSAGPIGTQCGGVILPGRMCDLPASKKSWGECIFRCG